MLDQDISPPIVLVQQRAFTSWQAIRLLTVLFFCWKLLLFSVVALAPGPGYDTSTTLLIDDESPSGFLEGVGAVSTNLPLVLKFVRWDAIYFSQIAQRGYLFEQEWAFGPGFPNLVAFLHNGNCHTSYLALY